MTWRPWEVRRAGLAEFAAAARGWLRAQGVDPDSRPFGRADLERLKEKVGHGQGDH